MIDDGYKNAFKEVYEILQNTDEDLVKKLPQKFINFLQDNMNKDYKTNVNTNIPIDKQSILSETENILSLIYRSYWATNEEKQEFYNRDKQELAKTKEYNQCQYKNIDELFEKGKNLNKVTLDNNLIVIEKENILKKLLKKILNIFHKKTSYKL